ncbi:MAG TPA: AMP-binding protein [Melioribacteraceae bacterium]|nr:AMP-binding protein [Melioribacteraceae bacterium]
MFLKKSDKIALHYKDIHLTYNELVSNVNKYANIFKNKAKKVAVFSENRPEWVYSFYSIWKNDCVAITIDFMSTPDEVAYILNDAQPEFIFCSIETHKLLISISEKLLYTPNFLVFESINLKEISEDNSDLYIPDIYKTALIIYTSGTTSTPKGVMLSYDNLLANIEAVVDANIYREDIRVMVLLPLHHALPLMGTMIIPLFVNATIAFSPSLNAEDLIATLQKHKITMIIGVPRFYTLLRRKIKDKINEKFVTRFLFKTCEKINSFGFSKVIFSKVHKNFGGHLVTLVCGGAALDFEVERDFRTLGFEILVGYGMTECAPMISFPRPGKARIGASGQQLSCNEIKVVDNEIITRGRNIMQGYYNKPKETAEIIKDGWLYTGDLGFLDKEGYIFITGRKKELIILSNGKNISPVEIEEKIAEISEIIHESAVFAKGDAIHIIIHPDNKKLENIKPNELEDFIKWNVVDVYNKKAAQSKKISRFYIVDEDLPRTRLGKIKRYELEKFLQNINVSEKIKSEEPSFEEYLMVKNYLKDLKTVEVHSTDHLELDLALDSLDKVSFQLFLKTSFGLEITNEELAKFSNVLSLSEYVKNNKIKTETESIDWSKIFKQKIELKLPKSWVTHGLLKSISKYLLKVYFRIKSEGVTNLPEGPAIITPNHQSFIDGLFVSIFLKNSQLKEIYYYAKEKHVNTKLLKFIADKHNVIVMDLNKL